MSTVIEEDPNYKGSRDKLRGLLKELGEAGLAALLEVGKLHEGNKKRIEYRQVDAYLGIALNHIELARIEMRKRKRIEPKQAAPPTGAKPERIEVE